MAIEFTRNHQDLSTEKGFQFKFFCDKCGNGFASEYVTNKLGMAGSLLNAAGSFFGGVFNQAGSGAHEIQKAVGGKQHDDAMRAAVEEMKPKFRHCTRCGHWVCPQACWNAKAGLCEECAPDFEEQFTANRAQAMADAARNQLYEKAQQTEYTANVDMRAGASTPQSAISCPTCGAKTTGSKFCPECGGPLQVKLTCTGCGHQPEGAPKFCPECGVKMPLR